MQEQSAKKLMRLLLAIVCAAGSTARGAVEWLLQLKGQLEIVSDHSSQAPDGDEPVMQSQLDPREIPEIYGGPGEHMPSRRRVDPEDPETWY